MPPAGRSVAHHWSRRTGWSPKPGPSWERSSRLLAAERTGCPAGRRPPGQPEPRRLEANVVAGSPAPVRAQFPELARRLILLRRSRRSDRSDLANAIPEPDEKPD